MTTLATTVLEAPVDQVLLPVTFGVRSGTMRLADGRLRYTRGRRRQVVFDAPLHELHSFARSSMGTGFHLWHGATRYRFVVQPAATPVELGPGAIAGVAESVAQIHHGVIRTARSRAGVDAWHDALAPSIAAGPPDGVEVRPPWSPRRFLWSTIGLVTSATVVLVGAITAIVAVTS